MYSGMNPDSIVGQGVWPGGEGVGPGDGLSANPGAEYHRVISRCAASHPSVNSI